MDPKQASLVSILVPVFNAEPFLYECINSILDQNYTNWELILVNDFSEDNSLEILEEFARKDSRIKVVQNSDKGIIPALRNAFSKSIGEYITRMDADDIMTKDKISSMLNLLVTSGKGNLATGLVKYFSDIILGEGYIKYEKWLNALSLKENNFTEIYKECVIPSPCWMIHREDLVKVGAFNFDIYPEDYELVFRFRKAGLKVKTVQHVIHHWRDHSFRSSRTKEEYSDNSFVDLKINKFLLEDLNSTKPLVLWGAGKKGKRIAKKLTGSNVAFIWLCDNEKKIGKDIYGTQMKSFSKYQFGKNSQIISAVAQKNTQSLLIDKISAQNLNGQVELFEFC